MRMSPDLWSTIKRQIQEQAPICEECGNPGGVLGEIGRDGIWRSEESIHRMNASEGESLYGELPWCRISRLQVTIMDLEFTFLDPTNFRNLCGVCRLRIFQEERVEKARETRERNRLERQPRIEGFQ